MTHSRVDIPLGGVVEQSGELGPGRAREQRGEDGGMVGHLEHLGRD